MLDDAIFEPTKSDLPDLEVLLWKLAQRWTGRFVPLDDNEDEYIIHLLKAPCPICTGTGQDGMHHDGSPIECKTCQGRGK